MGSSPFEVRVDTRDLAQVKGSLHTVVTAAHADLPAAVTAAAKPLSAAVRRAAGFSRRIPASISVKTAPSPMGGVAVQLVADASIAPHAAPINNRGQSGEFEHPVFGRPDKVKQAAHPFFHKPAAAHAADAEKIMATRVLDDAARKAGFR